MRPAVVSVTGIGSSGVYPVDNYIGPVNLGMGVIVSGTITFKVQYTYDDVFAKGYSPASGNWIDSALTGSANAAGNIAYPATGIRLTTTAGTGTATLTIIQAGGGAMT
jgi:hypothetical protein